MQQRGFAAAAWAHDRRKLAGRHGERHIAQRSDAASIVETADAF
jgi:hypothetical protein